MATQTLEFNVTGMTCGHCVQSVTNAVGELPGVADVKVSLEGKSATVQGESLDEKAIVAAIADEGYEAALK
ncbi:MAG: heavy-metal-associated domain-containing protein [Dehalococcoidia bacterium]|nr:heavy-metal-associated domain-containing protein [Dehalococcoidia bacterium]